MVTVIELSTKEREEESLKKIEEYFDLYYNSNLSVVEIRKRIGVGYNSSIYKDIQRRQRNEVSPIRRARLILNDNWGG